MGSLLKSVCGLITFMHHMRLLIMKGDDQSEVVRRIWSSIPTLATVTCFSFNTKEKWEGRWYGVPVGLVCDWEKPPLYGGKKNRLRTTRGPFAKPRARPEEVILTSANALSR